MNGIIHHENRPGNAVDGLLVLNRRNKSRLKFGK